jgi:hypothetical protein
MTPKLPKGTLEKLWSDPGNWRGPFYFSKSDPRKIVPKRLRWTGWTFNFAHPSARIDLVVTLLKIAILCALLLYLKQAGHDALMYALLAGVVAYSWWDGKRKSSPQPYEESD